MNTSNKDRSDDGAAAAWGGRTVIEEDGLLNHHPSLSCGLFHNSIQTTCYIFQEVPSINSLSEGKAIGLKFTNTTRHK